MKEPTHTTRRALALVLFALTAVSCGDDGLAPLGGENPPQGYRATLETFGGTFDLVCGTSSDDVYALGDAILHYDGTRWSPIELPARRARFFTAAWAGGAGLVLADGDGDVFVRKDGHWIWDASFDRINDMWASGPADVYAIGYRNMLHFDGTEWSSVDLPPHDGLFAVTGTGADDVVAVGERGLVLEYDGAAWTAAELDSFNLYRAVARSASGRTFVADHGRIFEITGSTPKVILDQLNEPILCIDGETLYAVGRTWSNRAFSIRRYDGAAWSIAYEWTGDVTDMWISSDGVLFVVGRNGLLWRSTGQGGDAVRPYPLRLGLMDAWSTDGTVFLAGAGAYRVDDGVWTDLNKEYVTSVPARSLHGRNRHDIYAVGEQMILHFDGARWTWVNAGLGTDLRSVWVDEDQGVLAVGQDENYDGVLVEYDGREWKRTPIPTKGESLGGVWGSGERAFIVGANGLIVARDNGEWRVMTPPTSADLTDVWGLDDQHVYAISSTPSEICFYDGRTWEALWIREVYVTPMASVWGTSPDNLFVVDDFGTIARYDGRTWSPLPRMLGDGVRAVCGLRGRDVMTAGYYGTVVYERE
jgi:hypothetical protein